MNLQQSESSTRFEPMTETYSSYMARLAQNAFKNKMNSLSSPAVTSSSSSVMRRAPPPPPPPTSSISATTIVADHDEQNSSPNYQQIFRSAPGVPPKLPKSPPPPPSLQVVNPSTTTTISSSAVEFLDTLSEREKLYQARFGPNGLAAPPPPPTTTSATSSSSNATLTTPPTLLEEILALQASSQSWRSRNGFTNSNNNYQNDGMFQAVQSSSSQDPSFIPPKSNPAATLMALQIQEHKRKSSSALLSALNHLKQTPIVRSASAGKQKQEADNNFSSAADQSTSAASGSAFFDAVQQRLNSSQDFSSSNRISKFLGQPAAKPKQQHEDDQKISNLFSKNNSYAEPDLPSKKIGLDSDLDNAKRLMSITSYSVARASPSAANLKHDHSVVYPSSSASSSSATSSPLKATRQSLNANIQRSTDAQRKQHLEAERVLDQVQSLNRIEQRITDHQNEHTKLRAQRLLDVDRARWEVQRVDFRVLEVQSQMDAACVALQERLLSRVATIRQLQDDAVRQNELRLHSAVKGEHDRRIASFREQTAERASTVESLRVALQQLAAHVEVQCARIEHDLSRKAISAAMERLAAIRHTLKAEAGRSNRSVESLINMVQTFAEETTKQLAELRDERLLFHERMARRVEEMRAARLATDARHRARVVTPSSFRAPSM